MKLIFLNLTLIILLSFNSYSQSHLWSYSFGGISSSGTLRGMCEDKDGNYILTGDFNAPMLLNNGQTITPVNERDIFVLKVSSQGQIIWGKSFGSNSSEHGVSVKAGNDNSIYISGIHLRGLKIGKDTIGTSFPQFLLKLTPNGEPAWMKPIMGYIGIASSGTNYANGMGMELDKDDNIIISSNFDRAFTLNGINAKPTAEGDVLVSKYNSEGELQWVNTLGTGYGDVFEGHTVDSDGNVYVTVKFGSQDIQYNNSMYLKKGSIMVAKFSPSGQLLKDLILAYDGMGGGDVNGLKFSPYTGKIYFARHFNGTHRLNGFRIKPSTSSVDIFLAELNTDLELLSVTQVGGPSTDILYCLSVGPYGLYLAGNLDDSALFQSRTLNSQKAKDILFLASLDYHLNLNWTKEFTGSYYTNSIRDVIANDSTIVVNGSYGKTLTYDDHSVTTTDSGSDFFMLAFREEESRKSTVSGTVYRNKDGSCQEAGSIPMKDVFLHLSHLDIYTKTNESGEYKFSSLPGNYQITQIHPPVKERMVEPACSGYTKSVTLEADKRDENFFNKVTDCYYLTVDISSDRRRRCFRNNTLVTYSNAGFAPANGVEVKVIFPPFVKPIKSVPAWSYRADSMIVFPIGALAPGESGIIRIIDSVSCHDPNIRGINQCTKAIIAPDNVCVPVNTSWDGSDIEIEGECQANGFVKFSVKNSGEGNMQDYSSLYIIENGEILLKDELKLQAKDQMQYQVPTSGSTIRIQTRELIDHPFQDIPSLTISGCGLGDPNMSVKGYTLNGSMDGLSEQVKLSCMDIRDSYDPNDKSVFPEGATSSNLIKVDEALEYLIRFQNTGTDTAYKVVIIDTLDANLDISTLQVINSSHSFDWEIKGNEQHYLVFTFNNIALVHMSKNAPLSNGFVKYKILPKKDLQPSTEINNKAYIFFDYNFPVITNNVFHTITDDIPYDHSQEGKIIKNLVLSTDNYENMNEMHLFPNPATGSVHVKGLPEKMMTLILYTCNMRQTFEKTISNEESVDLGNLEPGMYFYQITGEKGFRGKLVIK